MPNINIELPEDLHKKLKLEAVKKEITLKDLIILKIDAWKKQGRSKK